jgi:methylmalonyl-CoA mutase
LDKKSETIDDWRKLVSGELRQKLFDELKWQTPEGIEVKPLYTAEDLEDIPHRENLPGFFPFTRGVRGSMYTGRPWTIRQYAGFSTAEESNAFYHRNLEAGQWDYRSHLI